MSNKPKLIERVCEMCGEHFPARVSDVKRGFGRLCSPECRGIYANQIKSHLAPVFKHVAPMRKKAIKYNKLRFISNKKDSYQEVRKF